MEKSNKLYLIIIITCTVLVIGLCVFAIANRKDTKVSDAIKFKEEYEAYNGLVNESVDKNYLDVDIDSENPMIYKTGKEIVDVLKNETAIVYFGFATCPWCRNTIGPLLKAAKDEGIDKIYYVDIYDIRDTYKFTGSIVPEQTKKGTDAYYEILKFLGDNLEEYYVKDESGNMYDTGVTRLYAPTVVAVKDGKVLDLHESTLDSQTDPYVALTGDQKDELTDIFQKLMQKTKDNKTVCSDSDDAC